MNRYVVVLEQEDGTTLGPWDAFDSYRLRYLAERKARQENKVERRLGQDLGTWAVWDVGASRLFQHPSHMGRAELAALILIAVVVFCLVLLACAPEG